MLASHDRPAIVVAYYLSTKSLQNFKCYLNDLPAILMRKNNYVGKSASFNGQYEVIKANMRGYKLIRAKAPENAGNINLSVRFA